MSKTVPMVRAMALSPSVRWLLSNRRAADPHLRVTGLQSAAYSDPLRPVSMLAAGAFLQVIAAEEGPDIPFRIVSEADETELAMLGKVALGSKTPAEAFKRISAALPLFCTHEQLSLQFKDQTLEIRHAYTVPFEKEISHLMLQYAVAMAQRVVSLSRSNTSEPTIIRIEIPPHPIHGVEHLRSWMKGTKITPGKHGLFMVMDRKTAEKPFPRVARDRLANNNADALTPLRGDGTYSSSARIMLTSMLEDGIPSLEDLAHASGTSVRSLQRWLKAEGSSFAMLLDEVREERACRLVSEGDGAFLAVAVELGYNRQSSLTRAMRRWTGLSPSEFKKRQGF